MQHSCDELKHIFLMFQNINRQFTQSFEKETGISLTRYEMLYTLFTKGDLSQSELQHVLKIDQAAITRHLKILEQKSFVIRNRNQQNNREVIVQITDVGKEVLEHCDVDRKQFFDKLFSGFSEQQVHQLQLLTEKLMVNTENNFI
ncbi:MAG TPA: MarR family transcriptional regulator [Ureibacillus sp.]|nr:MarR family transcriptional regulator [Ureibacillus sp.]